MAKTLAEAFLNTLRQYPKDDFMLYKKEGRYVPLSTQEFGERVKHLALGLRELGFAAGDRLSMIAENGPNWVITDFAVICSRGLLVPLYTTLPSEQIHYIVEDSDAKILVVSTLEQWMKIEPLRSRLPKVRHYILMTPEAPPGILTFDEVLAKGRAVAEAKPRLFDEMAALVKPDDEATIIYTSGTTGPPKGVILTHDNFLSNVKVCIEIIGFTSKDTVLSFLPLSHSLERMVTFVYVYVGATIGYAESVDTVAQNLLEIRPTVMVSVPRVFEKIYARVVDLVLAGSALKKKIFFWALKVGKTYGAKKLAGEPISGVLSFKRSLAHKLVFHKIIEKTGGRIRFFVSGAAPLSKDIAEFFYGLGLIVLEGYGLTETSPVLSVNTLENIRFGTVGKPIPGVTIKIAPDGEILAKGPNIMKGYYKKEAETREAMEGGWFHTGDIGRFDKDGFLVITDRKKDLIVTSGGKNVAPQPIENMLKTNPYIASAVVLGDRQRFVSALIVPNFEKLEAYARANNISFGDRRGLVANPQVVSFLTAEVDRATPGLAPYEKIKKIAVLERDFEIEKGEMTPSLKVRRRNVEERYKDVIAALYREEGAGGRDLG
jgi:long-chain acyl-CoA synthetase